MSRKRLLGDAVAIGRADMPRVPERFRLGDGGKLEGSTASKGGLDSGHWTVGHALEGGHWRSKALF
jgi:hypothetical protein